MIVGQKTSLPELEKLEKKLSSRWGEESETLKEVRRIYPSGATRERAEQVYKDFETAASAVKLCVILKSADMMKPQHDNDEVPKSDPGETAREIADMAIREKLGPTSEKWNVPIKKYELEAKTPESLENFDKVEKIVEKARSLIRERNLRKAKHELEHAFMDLTRFNGQPPRDAREGLKDRIRKALWMIDDLYPAYEILKVLRESS